MARSYDLQKRAMLGRNLAAARQLAGYSQSAVMHKIWGETGSQKNRISEIESGKSLPDLELFTELCKLYAVSADYICGLSAEPEIDQTAGRTHMIYGGLQEVAADLLEKMVENLSRTSINYIASMPEPHAMVLLKAVKQVCQEYAGDQRDKIRLDYPALSQAIFEMGRVAQQFDKAQSINLTRYNTALDEVLQRDSTDPKHYMAADMRPRQKRYPVMRMPQDTATGQRKGRCKAINQPQLNWPTVADIDEDGNSED